MQLQNALNEALRLDKCISLVEIRKDCFFNHWSQQGYVKHINEPYQSFISNHIRCNYVWCATDNHGQQMLQPNIIVLVGYYFVFVQHNDLLAGIVSVADRHIDIQDNQIKQQLQIVHWLLDSEKCLMSILNWDHYKTLLCHQQIKDKQLDWTVVRNQAPLLSYLWLLFFFFFTLLFSYLNIDWFGTDLTFSFRLVK